MEIGSKATSPAAVAAKSPTSLESFTKELGNSNDRLGSLVERVYEISNHALGPQPAEVLKEPVEPETYGLLSNLQHQLGQQHTLLNNLDTILERLETFC